MKQAAFARLRVEADIEGVVLRVGQIAWSKDDRVAAFEFDPAAIAARLPISPFRVKPAAGVIMGGRNPFDGLHGVFSDSLPDGWGRLLVDRQIAKIGGNPTLLTPVDRLAIVGSRGMGALTYTPENVIAVEDVKTVVGFDWFARQAELILQGQSDVGVPLLLEASGGSAGARPKILALRDPSTGTFSIDAGKRDSDAQEHWLVKLKHRREGGEVGRVEHAYAKMAGAAGIDFPDVALIEDAKGEAHFGVRRFDRSAAGRIHVHSLAGLLHADFRMPSLDYIDLLKVTKILTKDPVQVEEAFRRMVFNVLAGNRDDHAKNHAFLMGKDLRWRLSPAYDVTLSDGPGGEHNMTIAGEGRAPAPGHFAKVAMDAGIAEETAMIIIGRVTDAVASWHLHAQASRVGSAEAAAVAQIIDSNTKSALGRDGSVLRSVARPNTTKLKMASSARLRPGRPARKPKGRGVAE